MVSVRYLCATALSLAVLTGCSPTKPPADLHVLAFTPKDWRIDVSQPLRLQFSAVAVAQAQVGPPLADPPVALDPPAAVTAHWSDRQTLVVQTAPLQPATRYTLRLLGNLADRSDIKTFGFVDAPLHVLEATGFETQAAPPTGFSIDIAFSLPVRAADAAQHCALYEGPRAVALSSEPTTTAGKHVILRAPALAPGTKFTLRCKDLLPAVGDAPLYPEFELALTTAPAFRVVSVTPTGGPVAPDETKLAVKFTTPVETTDLAEAVHLTPAAPGLTRAWSRGEGDEHEAVLDLDPNTTYTLSIDRELHDSYGQALAVDATPTFTFKTGGGRPKLKVDTGVVSIERGGPGYAIWTRNLTQVQLNCAPIARDVAGKILDDLAAQVAEYGDAANKPMVWHGLSPRQIDLPIQATPDTWHREPIDLAKLCGLNGRGLLLATFSAAELEKSRRDTWSERRERRVLANITDLGLVLKAGPASGLLWVVGLGDGQPVPDATVRIYTEDGAVTFRGKSDARGLVKLPGTPALRSAKQRKADDLAALDPEGGGAPDHRLLVAVEKSGDLAVVDSRWHDGLHSWSFGVETGASGAGATIRGILFSDRGIYRPGETVHLKGIVREADNAGMHVPAQRKVHVTVEDARGNPVQEQDVTASDFGGFAFDVELAHEASLGDWQVKATIGGATLQQSFLVNAFRKRTFEVKVQAQAGEPTGLQPVPCLADAQYLFGAPVVDAKLEWRISRRAHDLQFKGYEQFTFDSSSSEEYGEWGEDGEYEPNREPIANGAGRTNAKGQFAFTLQPAKQDGAGPQDYVIETDVTDAANATVSGHAVVTVYDTSCYVGLDSPWMADAGKPLTVQAVALGPSGEATTTTATLTLIREDYRCRRTTEARREYETCEAIHETVLTQTVALHGVQPIVVTPPRPGSYHLKLTGKDGAGRVTTTSSWLWVSGPGAVRWSTDDGVRMPLVASKRSYEPGETARLMARTSLPGGTALVTLERAGILDAQVVPMPSAGQPIDLLLGADTAPNVFASVVLVAGRRGPKDALRPRLQMGLVALPVSAEERRLTVEVSTSQEAYQPGDEVTATVRVTSHGEPVEAEVTLSVADEGVLQLIGYKTPDPQSVLYEPWGLAVETTTNWARLLRPRSPIDGNPDEGGDAGSGRVRERFLSSAYWKADLVTGADGTVIVRFPAPDDLTAFRVMAMTADRGARFGSADKRFTIRKPLMAVPALPRFLTPGDRTELAFIVHNHSGQAGEATVRLQATGVQLAVTERKIALPAEGSARVMFPGTVEFVTEATLQATAQLAGHADVVRMTLPVVRPLAIDRTVAGAGTTDSSAVMAVKWPAQGLVADQSRLDITVDRTGLAALEPALRALVEYPHGCLEQTLSRFVPLAKVKELAEVAGLDSLKGPALQKFLAAGAAKLVTFQGEDGHFSLWPGGRVEPHYTVYAMEGVLEAQRAGVAVDKKLAEDGTRALVSWAATQTRVDPNRDGATLAVAAYVLAELGKPDAGLLTKLFDARAALPVFAQAFVLRALASGHGPALQVKKLTDELAAKAVVTGDEAVLPEFEREDLWYWPSERNVRSTAATLSALLVAQPEHPLVPKLARYLLSAQHRDGTWSNTQDNAYAITALAHYGKRTATGQADVELTLDGKTLASQRLQGHEVLHLSLALADLRPGELRLTTQGKVRYLARVTVATRDERPPAQDHGFAIQRTWLDPDSGKVLTELRAGQLVLVRVEVTTPVARHDVAVVDPLPAGLEPVNVRPGAVGDDRDVSLRPAWLRYEYYDWSWTEAHDDQVRGFADMMPSGTTRLEYLARATVPGTFTAAPATVEAMYEPEIRGRSLAYAVVVR